MSKIFQLEGGQYEHPNEYKLVSTVRGTTILQPEFGTVIIEGDVIEASTHNTIQKNGVLASKVNVTMESTDTVLVPTDMVIESDLFNELKIMLLFETGTTLPINSFIKLKETNIPIANVNEYIVNANTPLLFLYFDNKFYAYKAGEGASTGAESLGDLSDVTLTSPTSGQALVYNGTKFVNKTISGGWGGGASKLDDLSDVVITAPTTNQTLVYNGTNFINKTQLATESIAGTIKISTTAQVTAGTDNTTAVSPAKLFEIFTAGSTKTQNGYQKLPGGLIVQWGTVDYNSDLEEIAVDVVFPSAFPTSCLNVTATRKSPAGNPSDGSVNIVSYSRESIRFQLNTWGAVSDVRGFTWFAIGY